MATDKEFYQLTVSINKALNPMEAPLKIKHARSVIIITHRTREAKSFWTVILRQPLMENRFTAWKFCHLLHKVLREGHESTLKHSQLHKKMILEMGKLWGHLQDGVGNCIQSYSKLLVTKLDFHQKNAFIPGALTLDFREVENYAGDDINIYFQLGVEIFDYLDDILEVQARVFSSINTYRMSSMTPQGQCRLAPLITLIQDSNPLYDLIVRIMFRLHDQLTSDVLVGHRDRFREMFGKLKKFYDLVRPLQYFADLIQVPHLPESAPNFTSKLDFGAYIPPVVYVPEPEPEPTPTTENLVDTSIHEQEQQQQAQVINALENNLLEREMAIKHLQKELMGAKESKHSIEQTFLRERQQLQQQIRELSIELNEKCELNAELLRHKDELELQLEQTQRVVELEEHERVAKEKFERLKALYTQTREDHINLLRKNGEITKALDKERQTTENLKASYEELKQQMATEQVAAVEVVKVELEQSKRELETELRELQTRYAKLTAENTQLQQDFEVSNETKSVEIQELVQKTSELGLLQHELQNSKEVIKQVEEKCNETQAAKEQLEQELQKHLEAHESYKQQKEQEIESLRAAQATELVLSKQALTAVQQTVAEKDAMLQQELQNYKEAIKEAEEKYIETEAAKEQLQKELQKNLEAHQNFQQHTKLEFENLRTAHDAALYASSEALSAVQKNAAEKDAELQQERSKTAQLSEAQAATLAKLQATELKAAELENQLQNSLKTNADMVVSHKQREQSSEADYNALLESAFNTLEQLAAQKFNEPNQPSAEKTLKYIDAVTQQLNEVHLTYANYANNTQDKQTLRKLAEQCLTLCHLFVMLHEQCTQIYNTTTDIEKGQDIYNEINALNEPLLALYRTYSKLQSPQLTQAQNTKTTIQTGLSTLRQSVANLLRALNTSVDLGDMVEQELQEMDKAIEEATRKFDELLSSTRSKNEGIKLEVNEKILDACTLLMESIKVLIKKSKILQDEIISSGRGNTSVKEFYKRNSQWTEGLISASKSVAKGANLLVDAANKAVTSETTSKNFEIIVAAQEIAACTVQLVMASKVKAPHGSGKLNDLTLASRNVSQATGAVVATVKDCNQQFEQSQEVDLTKLNSSQAKTMEMEIHVKVLELEQALQMERRKLASFRRQHYQNTED